MSDAMQGREWRQVEDGVWWLLFKEAPENPREARNGVHYPPSMVIEWCGYRTSCCHLRSYCNGAFPGEADEECEDYLHVCEPHDLIAELQAFIEAAGYVGEDSL